MICGTQVEIVHNSSGLGHHLYEFFVFYEDRVRRIIMFQTKEAQSLRILNTIFFVLMILANIFVESLPLNNITTAQVSTRNDTILTPTGITFAIWGVIYVWLFLFIL